MLHLAGLATAGAGLALYPRYSSMGPIRADDGKGSPATASLPEEAKAAIAQVQPVAAAAATQDKQAPSPPAVPVIPSSSAAPRLSIYDSPSVPIVLEPMQPTQLQMQVSTARKTAERLVGEARGRVREASNEWVGLERRVEHEVKSIIPADEPLTPGALYVGVSTLLGSILTRTRSFPIRFLSPPLALVLSSSYFLPKTASNVSSYTAALEKAYIPSVYEQQVALTSQVRSAWRQVSGKAAEVGGKAERAVAQAGGKLQEQSGLRLQQAQSAVASDAKGDKPDKRLV